MRSDIKARLRRITAGPVRPDDNSAPRHALGPGWAAPGLERIALAVASEAQGAERPRRPERPAGRGAGPAAGQHAAGPPRHAAGEHAGTAAADAPELAAGQYAVPAGGAAAEREVSRGTAANLLLAAGGLLVGIAAVAFTAVSWGSIGTGGRAGILLAVSALALAAPWRLRHRGLGGTAEAIAAIGLALTALDASLLYQLLLAGTDVAAPAAGSAIATAVLATGWAAYGTIAPVRGPRLAAIGLAQFPLPFAALAVAPSLASVTFAMVATAAGDLIIADLAGRRRARPERTAAIVTTVIAGSGGVLVALAAAAAVPDERESLRLTAVLILAAGVALAGVRQVRQARQVRQSRPARQLPQPAPGRPVPRGLQADDALAAASGALLAAGLGLPAAAALPRPWAAGAFAVVAAAVAAAGWWGPRWLARRDPVADLDHGGPSPGHASAGPPKAPVSAPAQPPAAGPAPAPPMPAAPAPAARSTMAGLAAGAAAVVGASGVAVVPAAIVALLAPLSWVTRPWSGAPDAARDALAPAAAEWYGSPATPLVLALVSIACWCVTAPARSRCRPAALAVAVLACVSIPLAADLRYNVALAVLTALAAVLLVAAAALADRILAGTAAVAGLMVAVTAAAWSLTRPAATIAELAVLLACCAVPAAMARTRLPAAAAAAGSVAIAAGLACAIALAHELPASHAGFAVLGVAAAAQVVAATFAAKRPTACLAAEVSGWLAAAAGTGMTLSGPGTASVGLTAAGVLCLSVAARPDRRPLLWAGLALLSGAVWAWLAVTGVHAPEPYAAPAAAVALAFGWQRSRHGALTSSWAAYGAGLGLLLIPSLVMAWQDQGWVRPLLLGLVAAAVMLAGGRARLQAPLLIGGTVAVLDAGRELADPVIRLAGILPGWVPFAVIGAVLLATGATYEARMRDVARIRAALGQLH